MNPRSGLNAEQRRWFHGSFCIDDDGRPRRLYHSTSADAAFDQFLPLTHFGTREAALRRASNMKRDEFVLYEAILNIRKPLVIGDSGRSSTFMIPDAVRSLPEDFWEDLSSREIDILMEGEDEHAVPLFLDYVGDFGYDGILYANTIEGGTSYCIFNPGQAWIAGAEEPGVVPRSAAVSIP